METNDFICPSCRGHINIGGSLILTAKNEKDDAGLILLSPEIGNYSLVKHKHFQLNDGEFIQVYCPICHFNLAHPNKKEMLARIIMIDKNGKESKILFSGIMGKKFTCKITNKEIESYGEHASDYLNFANLIGMA